MDVGFQDSAALTTSSVTYAFGFTSWSSVKCRWGDKVRSSMDWCSRKRLANDVGGVVEGSQWSPGSARLCPPGAQGQGGRRWNQGLNFSPGCTTHRWLIPNKWQVQVRSNVNIMTEHLNVKYNSKVCYSHNPNMGAEIRNWLWKWSIKKRKCWVTFGVEARSQQESFTEKAKVISKLSLEESFRVVRQKGSEKIF